MYRYVVAVLCWAISTSALAQEQTRIRGEVISFDGKQLTIRASTGRDTTVLVTDKTAISYPRVLKLSDLKPGTYIGSGAMPGPDGKLVAREVHVFPESQRGTGDGSRPWSSVPGGTMTNGGIARSVKAVNGQELTVQYKGGEQKILVPESTPIVTRLPGDASLLVRGSYVIVLAQGTEGSWVARSIQATGKDGVKPQ